MEQIYYIASLHMTLVRMLSGLKEDQAKWVKELVSIQRKLIDTGVSPADVLRSIEEGLRNV